MGLYDKKRPFLNLSAFLYFMRDTDRFARYSTSPVYIIHMYHPLLGREEWLWGGGDEVRWGSSWTRRRPYCGAREGAVRGQDWGDEEV